MMRTTVICQLARLVCLLGGGLSCGGSSGSVTGGAGGSAGGQPGNGGAGGSVGLAGAGGSAGEAGATDASPDGPTTPCEVTVDGGTVACTVEIVSGNDNDLYCGLKADGRINCWGASRDAFLFQPGGLWPPTLFTAAPDLAQVAITNGLAERYDICGVGRDGRGICWSDLASQDMGLGFKAIVLSTFGVCTLRTNGAVTCDPAFESLPPTTVGYSKILASENAIATLDLAGVPRYRQTSFPPGVYTDIATNDAGRVGAVRSDGTVVTSVGGANLAKPGSFRHVALDYAGRACALDAAGEVTCWQIETTGGLPDLYPLVGPFVQIVGAGATFCALRATGTTACWGDYQIDAPSGW